MLIWPSNIKPTSYSLGLENQSVSGGRTLSGLERVRQSDAGFWRLSLSFEVFQSVEILTWRAVLAQLSGRARTILIPICDCGRTPAALPDFRLVTVDVPHSDSAPFSDGSLYANLGVDVRTAAAVASRATAMDLEVLTTGATEFWPGMYFSIDDRLYIVDTVGERVDEIQPITFLPPLRAAAPAGTQVLFDGARGTFRLAEDMGGVAPLEYHRRSSVTVSFVEA